MCSHADIFQSSFVDIFRRNAVSWSYLYTRCFALCPPGLTENGKPNLMKSNVKITLNLSNLYNTASKLPELSSPFVCIQSSCTKLIRYTSVVQIMHARCLYMYLHICIVNFYINILYVFKLNNLAHYL